MRPNLRIFPPCINLRIKKIIDECRYNKSENREPNRCKEDISLIDAINHQLKVRNDHHIVYNKNSKA